MVSFLFFFFSPVHAQRKISISLRPCSWKDYSEKKGKRIHIPDMLKDMEMWVFEVRRQINLVLQAHTTHPSPQQHLFPSPFPSLPHPPFAHVWSAFFEPVLTHKHGGRKIDGNTSRMWRQAKPTSKGLFKPALDQSWEKTNPWDWGKNGLNID